METLAVLDAEPDRLREVPGLGARRVDEIKRTWASQRAISNVMMLLQTHGASPALASRIWQHYGDRSAAVVEQAPYRLALEVRGVGFKTADRLARALGIAGDHPDRAQAGVLHELEGLADQGHTVVPRPLLVERTAATLEIDAAHIEAAVDALWAQERVAVEDDGVAMARLHRAEVEVVRGLISPAARSGRAAPGYRGRARVVRARERTRARSNPAPRGTRRGRAQAGDRHRRSGSRQDHDRARDPARARSSQAFDPARRADRSRRQASERSDLAAKRARSIACSSSILAACASRATRSIRSTPAR